MHIHIFSGLGSSFVPRYGRGLEKLESELDRRGIYASNHDWKDWQEVLEQLNHVDGQPIGLIGHSQGVQSILRIARGYTRQIDYMSAIDPTLDSLPDVGSNIRVIDEFHATRGFVSIGRWFSRGRRGSLNITPRFKGAHKKHRIRGGHVAVASDPKVHSQIIRQLEAL